MQKIAILEKWWAACRRKLFCRSSLPIRQRHSKCNFGCQVSARSKTPPRRMLIGLLGGLMSRQETFWMACDSTEKRRAEYGPFRTRAEAELEARRLGFNFLLRYEHVLSEEEEIKEVRSVFIELPAARSDLGAPARRFYTRCAACGEAAVHEEAWQAEVWADIHEFEHSRHRVRLFEQTRAEGLKEIVDWREIA